MRPYLLLLVLLVCNKLGLIPDTRTELPRDGQPSTLPQHSSQVESQPNVYSGHPTDRDPELSTGLGTLNAKALRNFVNPLKPLPNVKTFRIKMLAEYDELALDYLKTRRRRGKPLFDLTTYSNGPMNRWLLHQVKLLNHYRDTGDSAIFWSIADKLMKSRTYTVHGLYSLNNTWHRDTSFYKIRSTVRKYQRMINNSELRKSISYHITWIPKPGTTEQRPLGVPDLHWRLYLHNLNQIMVIWLANHQPANQHGFWPGRGVGTAWRQILNGLYKKSDIWEFDFKKFFDSVSLTYLEHILAETGIPTSQLKRIISLQRSLPSGKEVIYPISTEELCRYWKQYQRHTKELPTVTAEDIVAFQSLPAEEQHPKRYLGVPQGSPLSPLLSTIILQPLFQNPNYTLVQYADDGVIFSDKFDPSTFHLPEGSGIRLHPDKCKWIKQSGK
jgi:hypothetical protein